MWILRERDYKGPRTFAVALGRLEGILKTRIKTGFFFHIFASMGNSPLPTYGRNFVKGKNSKISKI